MTTYPAKEVILKKSDGGFIVPYTNKANPSLDNLDATGTAKFTAKLDKANVVSKGEYYKGVYFDANGVAQPMSYELRKSVPANAQFTDTTYSQATSSTLGLTKLYASTGSNVDGTMTQQAITNALDSKASKTDIGTESTAGLTKLYGSTGNSTDGAMTRNAVTTELNAVTAQLNSRADTSLSNLTDAGNLLTFNKEVLTLSGTGRKALTNNRVHKITITGNTQFQMPTANSAILNQMLVLMYMPTPATIKLGVNSSGTSIIKYFYDTVPSMTAGGYYTLIYEHSGSSWYVGVIYKGT